MRRERDISMQAMLTQIELMSRPHVIVDLHNPVIHWSQPPELHDAPDRYADAWSPMELFD